MNPTQFFPGKKILITGGLGFLGSNLAQALIEFKADVTLYDALLPGYGGNLFNIEEIRDRVHFITGDIRDREAIQKAVKEKDIIFNIAAQTSHVDSMKDPYLDLDINCRGQLTLLEACREVNPHVLVVYAGSRAQYGVPAALPVTEETPMEPIDIYGAHKIAGEHYHFIYRRICGLRAVSLRLTNIYGHRHQMQHTKYGVQNFFLRLIIDDEAVPIFGNGKQLRDFLHVDDATHAFLLSASIPEAEGNAFVISSNQGVSLVAFVQQAIEIAKSGRIEYKEYTEERRKIESGDYIGDYQKFHSISGWKPRTPLTEGLAKTITFYRQYKSHYWAN